MKALVCELCGGNDLVKQDGYFVCQHCGTKYTVEEARKLMGTVKIDDSEEIRNLYTVARRAKDDRSYELAQQHYERLLVKDPSNWEPNYFSVYLKAIEVGVENVRSAAISVTNCEDTVLKLIRDNIDNEEEREEAVSEVAACCIRLAKKFFAKVQNAYDDVSVADVNDWEPHRLQYLGRALEARDIVYYCGDYIEDLFGSSYTKDFAVPCWKVAVDLHEKTLSEYKKRKENPKFKTQAENEEEINQYKLKISKYDPTYKTVATKESKGWSIFRRK